MTHVLLWSQRQNALHVESVALMLSGNRDAYRDNRSSDYVPIAMGTREELLATSESLRPTLRQREAGRVEQRRVA